MPILSDPPPSFSPEIRAQFALDPGLTFLNHGSFGSVPRPVREAQEAWRAKLEASPIEWIGRRNTETLASVKQPLAKFLGCRPGDLGFVTNATEGINAVLRSLRFEPGDELLTSDHVYNAIRQAMKNRAQESGARYVEAEIPLPVRSPSQAMQALLSAVTPRTRLIVIDHITSPTALRFQVEEILKAVKGTRAQVLVDGAHSPGAIPLSLDSLGADYYAANLHKWVMGPRGSAFLWVPARLQPGIHPCVISHEWGNGFQKEFDWQGTRDLSGWNALPAAISWLEEIGLERIMDHNHRLAAWAHRLLCRELSVEPISPLDGSMLACMASIRLPDALLKRFEQPEAFQKQLYEADRVEAPIIPWKEGWLLRMSAAIHNVPAHYERLAEVLRKYLA
ncbi:MAG: aminotransferase class V-fold PLP-dependent enzyme [Planctomycetes bacterium]|nr:aminotransferase class V-fold PLP-dependent enzyme [Planctomycetota bacterium]